MLNWTRPYADQSKCRRVLLQLLLRRSNYLVQDPYTRRAKTSTREQRPEHRRQKQEELRHIACLWSLVRRISQKSCLQQVHLDPCICPPMVQLRLVRPTLQKLHIG